MSKHKVVDYEEWNKAWKEYAELHNKSQKEAIPELNYIYSGLLKCYVDARTGLPIKENKNEKI